MTAIVLYVGMATNAFTHGDIRNLPLHEKDVISRIEQNGIRVVSRPSTGFGAPAQIVPDIHWDFSAGEYAVTAVTIVNADHEAVMPELKKFKRLKKVRVPYLSGAEAEKVSRLLPNVVVKQSFK